MKQFYTYLHCKPDGTPFYVGKGSGKRSHDFRISKRNLHHSHTIKKYGAKNILVYIFNCESEDQSMSDEIQQIAQLRHEGYKLCNQTDGGDGASGLKHSPQVRAKISANSKNRTSETLVKMSMSNTGKKHSPESCAKMSVAKKGTKASPETRAKMSASKIGNKNNLGHKTSDEARAKLSAAMKAYRASQKLVVSVSA
jgi:hypothetical protein